MSSFIVVKISEKFHEKFISLILQKTEKTRKPKNKITKSSRAEGDIWGNSFLKLFWIEYMTPWNVFA